jgi:hypothetical protein
MLRCHPMFQVAAACFSYSCPPDLSTRSMKTVGGTYTYIWTRNLEERKKEAKIGTAETKF